MEKDIAQIHRRLKRSKFAIFAIIAFLVALAFIIIAITRQLAYVQKTDSFAFNSSENQRYGLIRERLSPESASHSTIGDPRLPEVNSGTCEAQGGFCKTGGNIYCDSGLGEVKIGNCRIGTGGMATAMVDCCKKVEPTDDLKSCSATATCLGTSASGYGCMHDLRFLVKCGADEFLFLRRDCKNWGCSDLQRDLDIVAQWMCCGGLRTPDKKADRFGTRRWYNAEYDNQRCHILRVDNRSKSAETWQSREALEGMCWFQAKTQPRCWYQDLDGDGRPEEYCGCCKDGGVLPY